jgi:hypothetical protein
MIKDIKAMDRKTAKKRKKPAQINLISLGK